VTFQATVVSEQTRQLVTETLQQASRVAETGNSSLPEVKEEPQTYTDSSSSSTESSQSSQGGYPCCVKYEWTVSPACWLVAYSSLCLLLAQVFTQSVSSECHCSLMPCLPALSYLLYVSISYVKTGDNGFLLASGLLLQCLWPAACSLFLGSLP